MLQLQLEDREFFSEQTGEFYKVKGQTLTLEHSLISVYKWESKWHKPFLSSDEKTQEESLDYIRCMTIGQVPKDEVYLSLSQEQADKIQNYIQDSMTATWFNERGGPQKRSREIVTAELIYYWMIALNIPFECQKWHLNQLLTLIRVCSIKQEPGKKMSKADINRQNHALNAARKAKMHSHG